MDRLWPEPALTRLLVTGTNLCVRTIYVLSPGERTISASLWMDTD